MVFHAYMRSCCMTTKMKLSDDKIELLITFWQLEPCLWDSSDPTYSNIDARKQALRKISENLDGISTGMTYATVF